MIVITTNPTPLTREAKTGIEQVDFFDNSFLQMPIIKEMANESKIRRIPLISCDLKEIARSEGQPHLLDSDKERALASTLIEKAITERMPLEDTDDTSACEIDIFEEAQDILDDGNRLQVNPLFGDILSYRCRGTRIMGHFFLNGTVDVELLSEVDGDEYASFYVFLHGGGWRTQLEEETLSKDEWDAIVSPLSELNFKKHENMCMADAPIYAFLEREALKQTIARYEQVIGPKAGTANDLGGFIGNSRIDFAYEMGTEFRNRGSEEAKGQQDCINEMQTTRHLVSLLIDHGLLVYHTLNSEKSFISINYDHHALLLYERGHPEAQPWTVDSWVESNGHPPEILTEMEWYAKWAKFFGIK